MIQNEVLDEETTPEGSSALPSSPQVNVVATNPNLL